MTRRRPRGPYQPPLLAAPENPTKIATGAPPPSENEVATRRILAAIWPLAEPWLPPTTTVAAWRHRNKRAAAQIAALGVGIDAVAAAHARAAERLGGKCWSLYIVADELQREIDRAREEHRVALGAAPIVTADFVGSLR